MRTFKRINLEERIRIAELLSKGLSERQIAKELGRSPSGINIEIKRNSVNGKYDPHLADQIATAAQSGKVKSKVIKNSELRETVTRLILEGNSPEKVSEILKTTPGMEQLSYNTIYRAIKIGELPGVTMESIRSNIAVMYNKGCLTVPKHIREQFGFQDGDRFIASVNEDGVVMFTQIKDSEDS